MSSCCAIEIEDIDYLTTTDNAFVLVISKRALIADSYKRSRPNVAVAYRALSVTLITEASNRNSRLLAAHDKITRRL